MIFYIAELVRQFGASLRSIATRFMVMERHFFAKFFRRSEALAPPCSIATPVTRPDIMDDAF